MYWIGLKWLFIFLQYVYVHTYILYVRIHAHIIHVHIIHVHVHASVHAWQPILCESFNFKRFFYFLFSSFPSSSDLHIGSPEHSPYLLRRVFHQSSLLCLLLILSSIALECNKFYVKLSNDVLTFIVSFIFEFCDVSVAKFSKISFIFQSCGTP